MCPCLARRPVPRLPVLPLNTGPLMHACAVTANLPLEPHYLLKHFQPIAAGTHTHTHTINMLSMQDVKRGQGTRQRRWYQEARPMMISGSKADHLRVSQDLRRVAWEESTNANTSLIKCSSSCTDPCVSACGHGAQRIVWRESGEKRSGTHQRPGDTARFGACAGEYAWCYMVLDAWC